jgi:D-xylose transport system permease protein
MSTPNEPNPDRPPATADVAPVPAAEVTQQVKIGKFKIPTEALRAYTMMFALVAIWLFFQWATVDARNPYGLFLSAVNFSKLMQQTAVTGVLAVGMLMVIVCGQIDLSVGSMVGLAGAIAAMSQGRGLFVTLAAAIVIGLVVGTFQGALVAYANVPAFIVTLGGLLAWPGVSFWRTQGATIPVEIPFFRSLGSDMVAPVVGYVLAVLAIVAISWSNIQRNRSRRRHGLSIRGPVATLASIIAPSIVIIAFVRLMNSQSVGGVPIPFIIMFAVAIIGAFLTMNTTFGRYLYAIGGNPDAARLSGINLRRHILVVFALMGAIVGVAAILHTARLAAATPDAGRLMELDAIAACVIGGTSLMGGRGTVFGAIVGALIMASLDNGMNLVGVQSYVQPIVKGAVLVTAVGLDMAGRRRG